MTWRSGWACDIGDFDHVSKPPENTGLKMVDDGGPNEHVLDITPYCKPECRTRRECQGGNCFNLMYRG